MTGRISEHERDRRDLKILRLLDEGATQEQACARLGVTRGVITKLLREVRQDEAAK